MRRHAFQGASFCHSPSRAAACLAMRFSSLLGRPAAVRAKASSACTVCSSSAWAAPVRPGACAA